MKHAEPAASLLEREELRITDAEQRAAQDGDERQRVLWIGEGPQEYRQCADLWRLAKRAGSAHLDRNVQRFQRLGIRCQPVPLSPGENQEITVPATAGIDFRSNIGRDLMRVLFLDIVLIAAVCQREHTTGRTLAIRIERREARRV